MLTSASTNTKKSNFSSFVDKSVNMSQPPFMSKDLRFDGKLDLQEYFNRDPGPGTYQEKSLTFEKDLQNEMKKLVALDGSRIIKAFNAKEQRFGVIPDALVCDPKINVAPGQYDPEPIRGNVQGPKMDFKGDFSLPFNEKNPLNYVKPITVNIYFKQQTPGVGQYDPKPIEANPKGA